LPGVMLPSAPGLPPDLYSRTLPAEGGKLCQELRAFAAGGCGPPAGAAMNSGLVADLHSDRSLRGAAIEESSPSPGVATGCKNL